MKLFDQCIYHMLKGNQEYIQKSIVTPFLSYSRSVPFWLGKSIGDFPKNNANILSKVKEYPCILVAANNKYILKFIDRYIDSITIDSNIDFYIYWIDDEPETSNQVREKLSIISDKYSAGKFFIEYEKCPAFFDIRSYFACKRFIFVKKILKERVFAIITDIDYLVKGDLKRFINEIENNRYDVFVKLNNNNISSFFPWLKVTAGTFVVKNSSIGRYFIELFIFIFHQTFNPHGFNWGIDQNILTCLVELFDSMKCIGNLLEIYEPFTVPYDIKLNV
ncbi:MAG: hypothetical protein LBD84_02195 [Campylobacteraceae bacterium]|nr:hypothetical protein [Campylobacteraceae bacterium]